MVDPLEFYDRIKKCPHYFYPNVDWGTISAEIKKNLTLSNSRKRKYYEVPISFDIESTSFISSALEQKCACMYAFGYSIAGFVVLGRTWEDAIDIYEKLVEIFEPTNERRLIIYIQNLAYEFQFMAHRWEWLSIFSIRERKPLKCLTIDYVEFRCSYMLSGFSLASIGKNLQRYRIQKMSGDLDYSLIRHHKTPLTEKEWKYLINDVQVVVAYIQETAENDGGYHKIPLTKTGYVREYCREQCFKEKNYRKLIKYMRLTVDDYEQLKRAFAGGFTHANRHRVDNAYNNVGSFDFTSSYPYVMVAEKFPMSSPRLIEIDSMRKFRYYLANYCCIFDIEITGLNGWDAPDNILSLSKCRAVKNARINNGRIISADQVITTINEVDYSALEKFYKWESIRVANFKIMDKQYLPTPFVKAILKLYEDKTVLKGVADKLVEYMKSKGMINSCFGMTVTDIVRDENTFNDEWICEKAGALKEIEKYNNSKTRFLFYAWGVWVTSHARNNLYSGILEFGDDYIYADTDSLKVLNKEAHSRYLEQYNQDVEIKLRKACQYHGIDFRLTRPKTIKGVEKPLGVWDYEGEYRTFKTLGAKRYMVEEFEDGEWKVNITVAGLNKKEAVPYILEEAERMNVSPFDLFTNELYIPKGRTGKSIHTYIDTEFSSALEDYLGNVEIVHEYSAIHLEQAEYSLSLEQGFLNLIKGIKLEER